MRLFTSLVRLKLNGSFYNQLKLKEEKDFYLKIICRNTKQQKALYTRSSIKELLYGRRSRREDIKLIKK